MKPEVREALRSALIERDRARALAAARELAEVGRVAARHGLDAVAAALDSPLVGPNDEHDIATDAIELLARAQLAAESGPRGCVAVGTVAGDAHALRKQLFVGYARVTGFEVVDLGVEASAAEFAGAVREHRPTAVAVLCHLTIYAGGAARVIEELVRQRLRDATNVVLVGEPLTQEFAHSAGADAYASDPGAGAEILLRWLE